MFSSKLSSHRGITDRDGVLAKEAYAAGCGPNRVSHSRIAIMAKGMSKRGKDQKKPKKEVPKVIAAAASTKNDVKLTSMAAKPK
ncbi:MAG: hypothetical protein ACJASV_000333 [Pseudorhodobacter sp.]